MNTEIDQNINEIENRFEDIKLNVNNKNNSEYVQPQLRSSYENISYNQRNTIKNYAREYAFKRNPNYLSFDNDCANFASQALRKAGARADHNHKIYIDGRNRTWSLKPDAPHLSSTYGDAWAQSHYLVAFILRNEGGSRGPGGHKIKYGSRLDLGDLCFLHNGSSWFHTYIVVRPGSNFGVAAHTKDRYNVPINEAGKIPNTSRDYKRAYVHLATLN